MTPTTVYWLAAVAGLTIDLRGYRTLRRHFGLFPVERESPFGSVGEARFRQIQRTGK